MHNEGAVLPRFLFLTCALVAAVSTVNAQSLLKVLTTDGRRINVMLDGRYFNKTGTSVTIGDLPRGKHRIKIFNATPGRRGRLYEEVIDEGKVRTEDGMVTLLTLDPDADKVDMQEQDINTYLAAHPIPKPSNQQNNNYTNGNSRYPGQSMQQPLQATLTTSKIDQLKTDVAGKNTDTEKMNIAKDELKSETFTTQQVGTMMDLFSFESSKLDFVEWAYDKTLDKNYYQTLKENSTTRITRTTWINSSRGKNSFSDL